MKINKVNIEGFCALAPMAGVADMTFRLLCKKFGAAYTLSEMISAKAICMGSSKTKELMFIDKKEHPAAIQLFGNDPDIMADAAQLALSFCPDILDINMGCPTPKIVKNNSGCALMKNPKLAAKITKAAVDAVDIPVTIKFRTGWDLQSKNCVEFAKIMENCGAAALTVHGRTKEQLFAPPVDFEAIKNVKNAVDIPVIGNGDIFTPEQAKFMFDYTNCDLIMTGRGALGRPWLFSQINEYLSKGSYSPEPDTETKMKIMLEHAREICKVRGQKNAMLEIRKHALWYTKGLRDAAKLRKELSLVSSMEKLELLAEEAAELQPCSRTT